MDKMIYSIGLGPGDPELITVKAAKILEQADIVMVPQSDATGRSVARDIVLHYIDREKIDMYYFPMNNDREELQRRYTELAERIKILIDEKRKVVYVTMGDPTIFSTSNYLTERLNHLGVLVSHIPGISSINAVSSLLGLPLCVKGENFGVYEMPGDVETAVTYIKRHPTTVFLKVNKKLPPLMEAVNSAKPVQAFLVGKIGLENEVIYNMLNCAPPPEAAYLSVAVIKQS